MKLFSILVLVNLAAFCGGAQAAKVLALLENLALKETHSMYFKRLTDAGQEVSFKVAEDPSIEIKKDGKNLYDHLVIFSPTVEELRGSLSGEDIGEFIHDGGNLLIAGSSRGGDMITDHENLRVLDILTGCSFSRLKPKPITEYPHVTGKNAELSAGLQARNNGRVIFSGSMDLFSDEKFSSLVEKEKAGSGALSAWCSQMAGAVRIDSVEHHLDQSFEAKIELVMAHYGFLLCTAFVCYILDIMKRARFFSFCWILIISSVASPLFWNFLRDTSNISDGQLGPLGPILIMSGFHLLQRGPTSPLPIIISGLLLVGSGHGATVTALKAARAAACSISSHWYLKSLCSFARIDAFLGPVLGFVLLPGIPAITFNSAILILVCMEMVFIVITFLV